jgi:hypothetical protein
VSAHCFAAAAQGQIKPLAKLAHPANLPRRDTDHKRICRHILVYYGAGTDECILANRNSANNRAVRAQGRPPFDQSVTIFALAIDERPGIIDICKHHAWTAKHVALKSDIVVDRDIILNFAVGPYYDLIAHENILAEGRPRAYSSPATNMRKMPDPRIVSDFRAFIDDRRWVDLDTHFNAFLSMG